MAMIGHMLPLLAIRDAEAVQMMSVTRVRRASGIHRVKRRGLERLYLR